MTTHGKKVLASATGGQARLLGLGDLMKVSRAGLIASHLWLFFLPVALSGQLPGVAFWVGALYVTVPLGLLIYGWNDFRDADVDALSRRKRDSTMAAWFGYRLGEAKRRLLPAAIVALQLPFVVLTAAFGQLRVLLWLPAMALANALYNGPGVRLSRLPVVAELTALWIYINILWLSVLLSGIELRWPAWALAATVILAFQVAGAIVDIPADRRTGKRTLAAVLGERRAALALAVIVAIKAALLGAGLQAPLAALLNLAAVPLCLARPAFVRVHWSGLLYVYFVLVDWICLGLLTVSTGGIR